MNLVTPESKNLTLSQDPRAHRLANLDKEIVRRLSPFARAVVEYCREEIGGEG